MKKICLSILVLACIFILSCNKDDNNNNTDDNCVTCSAVPYAENGIGNYTDKATICKAGNGNAVVNGVEMQKEYDATIDYYTSIGSDCR